MITIEFLQEFIGKYNLTQIVSALLEINAISSRIGNLEKSESCRDGQSRRFFAS